MLQRQRRIEQFLVACTQHGDLEEAGSLLGDAVTYLGDAASYQGVAGFVHTATAGTSLLPPEIESRLHDESLRASIVRQQVQLDLNRIVNTLDEGETPVLVLKGPVLDKWVYRHRDRRSYNDLDLLVHPHNLERTVEILVEDGCTLLDQNWELLLSQLPGEVHLCAPMGTVVDLHWHILNETRLRSEFLISGEALMDHATRVSIDDIKVPTLEPEPMLIQVALHACLSGADRLVWVKDVEQCATAEGLDWDEVVRLAELWRVLQPVALSLTRAQVLLGLELPEGVSRRLGVGRGYCRADAWLTNMLPVLGGVGGRTLARPIARAAQSSGRHSAAELTRRSFSALTQRFHDSDRIIRDATDPASILHSSGTNADRDRFFRTVAASATARP